MTRIKINYVIVKQDGTIQDQLIKDACTVQRKSVGIYQINYDKLKFDKMPWIQLTSYDVKARCTLESYPGTANCVIHCLSSKSDKEEWILGSEEFHVDAPFLIDIQGRSTDN